MNIIIDVNILKRDKSGCFVGFLGLFQDDMLLRGVYFCCCSNGRFCSFLRLIRLGRDVE